MDEGPTDKRAQQPGGHDGTETDHQEGRREDAGAEVGRETETISHAERPGDDDAAEARGAQALRLREEGKSWPEIGKAMGISASYARNCAQDYAGGKSKLPARKSK